MNNVKRDQYTLPLNFLPYISLFAHIKQLGIHIILPCYEGRSHCATVVILHKPTCSFSMPFRIEERWHL